MVLSLLIHARSLRFAAPTALLLSVAPQYFAVWLAWRTISIVMPRRAFEAVDEFLYGAYQAYVTYFFEVYNGTKVIFYGDHWPTDKKESVLYISNHQSSVDWVVTDMIAIRQGSLGSIRFVLKDGLRYFPLYGFYFAQVSAKVLECFLAMKRYHLEASSGIGMEVFMLGEMTERMRTESEGCFPILLLLFITLMGDKIDSLKLWLVIFPEGTRFNVNKPEAIRQSQKFSEENDIPIFNHVLVPRAKATQLSLEELGDYIDAVYDVTIAYKDPTKNIVPRAESPSLTEFLADGNQELHIHVSCIRGDEIPKTSQEIKTWLLECFEKKEKLLSAFYDEETGGKFPGQSYTVSLPFSRTFIPTLVFGTTAVLSLVSPRGRSLYWKWTVGSCVSTLMYMSLFYDALQT